MRIGKPKALLIGEKPVRRSKLAEHLEGRGCECMFASSYDEVHSYVFHQTFDLVLSPMRLNGVTLFPLMDLFDGSEATLFYFHAVEEGFWCLPALRQGQRCFGESGLRHDEFLSHLDELIAGIQAHQSPAFRSGGKDSNVAILVASTPHPDLLPPGPVRESALRTAMNRKAGA